MLDGCREAYVPLGSAIEGGAFEGSDQMARFSEAMMRLCR